MSSKLHKARDKQTRARWNNERKFRLGKSRIPTYNQHILIAIQKHSVLFDTFYPIILRLQAGDIIEQLAKFYYLNYAEEVEESELQPIVIDHIMPGTFGCFIGLSLAFLAFLAEKYSIEENRFMKRMEEKLLVITRRRKNVKPTPNRGSVVKKNVNLSEIENKKKRNLLLVTSIK